MSLQGVLPKLPYLCGEGVTVPSKEVLLTVSSLLPLATPQGLNVGQQSNLFSAPAGKFPCGLTASLWNPKSIETWCIYQTSQLNVPSCLFALFPLKFLSLVELSLVNFLPASPKLVRWTLSSPSLGSCSAFFIIY